MKQDGQPAFHRYGSVSCLIISFRRTDMQRPSDPVLKMPKKVHALIPAETERIGKAVLDAAFKVHTALGPGLLESVYETACAYEVRKSGLVVATQVELPICYDGQE